jgi:hypothetical protein
VFTDNQVIPVPVTLYFIHYLMIAPMQYSYASFSNTFQQLEQSSYLQSSSTQNISIQRSSTENSSFFNEVVLCENFISTLQIPKANIAEFLIELIESIAPDFLIGTIVL